MNRQADIVDIGTSGYIENGRARHPDGCSAA